MEKHKGTRLRSCVRRIVLISMAIASFDGCMTVFRPESVLSRLEMQKKGNGYLVELECTHKPGDVDAFILPDNWIVITIVGVDVDFDRLRSTEPNNLVSDVEVIGRRTSVQSTLKPKQKFRSCEVIQNRSYYGVSMALFTEKNRP